MATGAGRNTRGSRYSICERATSSPVSTTEPPSSLPAAASATPRPSTRSRRNWTLLSWPYASMSLQRRGVSTRVRGMGAIMAHMSDAPPGLDLAAVTAWLEQQCPGLLAGPPSAALVAGGRANLTYVLDDEARRFVLRRPPLGHVLATAHDMSREHRVLSALHGTVVPVPQPLALCADESVTGAPFYVMAHVDGAVLRRRSDVEPLPGAGRRQLVDGMMDVLADLHGVDPAAVGLADFGRPEGFMARQVRRWGGQLDASRSRDLAGIDELRAGLQTSVPEDGDVSVVHGDYRLDNLVVAGPSEPDAYRVRSVLDWEMATLGDPLGDLGLL